MCQTSRKAGDGNALVSRLPVARPSLPASRMSAPYSRSAGGDGFDSRPTNARFPRCRDATTRWGNPLSLLPAGGRARSGRQVAPDFGADSPALRAGQDGAEGQGLWSAKKTTLAKLTGVGPLSARPAGEPVRQLTGHTLPWPRPLPACPAGEGVRQLAAHELLHLPGKPAGVVSAATPSIQPTNCFTCRASRQGS